MLNKMLTVKMKVKLISLAIAATLISMTILTLPVFGQGQTCDEFDGTSINSSIWNQVGGSWTLSSGKITGYWSLSSAQSDQANLLLSDAAQPAGDYTFETDIVSLATPYTSGHRIVLYQSAGNKYNIAIHDQSKTYLVEVRVNSGSYQMLIPSTAISNLDNTANATNRVKVIKAGNQFAVYVNEVYLFTLTDTHWNGNVKIGIGAYGDATYDRACITSGGQVPVDVPSLISPLDNASVPSSSAIDFAWEVVDWATEYGLEISMNPDVSLEPMAGRPAGTFNSIADYVSAANVGTWTALADHFAPGTYYWHVMASCDTIQGLYSPIRSFTVQPPPDLTDWPLFGHDNLRTARTSTEVLPPFKKSWNEDVFYTNSKIRAPAIVVGDTVFFANCAGNVYAVDINTKAQYWPAVNLAQTDNIVASPLYWQGRIYIAASIPGSAGRVSCLNSSNGSIYWSANFGANVIVTTPTLVGNKLLVYEGQTTHVLDAVSGVEVNSHSGGTWAPAAVWNGKAYFNAYNITEYNPVTNTFTQLPYNSGRTSPVAISADGHLYFSSNAQLASYNLNANSIDWVSGQYYVGDQLPTYLALSDDKVIFTYQGYIGAVRKSDGQLVWSNSGSQGGSYTGGPIIAGNAVFILNRYAYLYCFDLATGTEINYYSDGAQDCFSSPIAAKGKIIYGTDNSNLYAIETGQETRTIVTVWAFNDANGDGLKGAYDVPLPGRRVDLSDGQYGITNSEGKCSFNVLGGAQYSISVQAPAGTSCANGNPQTMTAHLASNNNVFFGFQKSPVLTITPPTYGPLTKENPSITFTVNLSGQGVLMVGKSVQILSYIAPTGTPGLMATVTTDANGNGSYTWSIGNVEETPAYDVNFIARFAADTEWGPAADTSFGSIAEQRFTVALDDPADGASVTLPYTFTWHGSYDTGPVDYTLEFAQNSNFAAPVYSQTLTTSEVNTGIAVPDGSLQAGQTLQWRVRAARTGKPTETSDVRNVAIQVLVGTLTPPQLVSPENGATVTPRPTFTWQLVSNANLYKLEISESSDFNSIKVYRQTPGTTSSITLSEQEQLSTGHAYYWRMATYDGTAWGPYSTSRTIGGIMLASNLVLSGLSNCRTGETVPFKAKLTDANGNPLAGKTINFTWSYTGLEPTANFEGSWTGTTDLLGECTLEWFSKWAAFTNNVTASISAGFAGDANYSSSSGSGQLQILPTGPNLVNVRVFTDLNGNGVWDQGIDVLRPLVPITISSAYNTYVQNENSGSGFTSISVPKCAYNVTATVVDNAVSYELIHYLNVTDFTGASDQASIEFAYEEPVSALTITGIAVNDIEHPLTATSGEPVTVTVIFRNSGNLATTAQQVHVFVYGMDRLSCIGSPLSPLCLASVLQNAASENVTIRLASNSTFPLPAIAPGQTFGLPVEQVTFSSPGVTDIVYVEVISEDPSEPLADIVTHSGLFANCISSSESSNTQWIDVYRDVTVNVNLNFGNNCLWEEVSLISLYWPTLLPAAIGVGEDGFNMLMCGKRLLSDITTANLKMVQAVREENLLEAVHQMENILIIAFRCNKASQGLPIDATANKLLTWLNIVEKELIDGGCIRYVGEALPAIREAIWTIFVDIYQIATSDELRNILFHVGCPVNVQVLSANGTSLSIDTTGTVTNHIDSAFANRAFGEDYILVPKNDRYSIVIHALDSGECHVQTILPAAQGLVVIIDFGSVRMERGWSLRANSIDSTALSFPLLLDSNADGQPERVIPPISVIALSGPGFASLSGHVKERANTGLLGVPLDVYDSDGNLWQSVVTDDSGYYHIDSIPNGNYTIAVVTPLGYQADQETTEFSINHVPVTVNFNLKKLNIVPRQRTRAYWADQLTKALSGKPKDFTKAQFSKFAGLIDQHFNGNPINPVENYVVPQPATQSDSLAVLKKLLNYQFCGQDEPFLKRIAKAELVTLMLNVAAGKVSQTQIVTKDSMTLSQAITYCDMLVNDLECPTGVVPAEYMAEYPRATEILRYIKASLVAGFINVGVTLPTGTIPADIMNIAYKYAEDHEPLPSAFSLGQNYPNPFNPITTISFSLPKATAVTIDVFNIMGQKVATLVNGPMEAGEHQLQWDGRVDNGGSAATGVYLYRLKAGEFVDTKKMLLLK